MRLVGAILAGLSKATQGLSTLPVTEGLIEIPPVLSPIISAPLEYITLTNNSFASRTSQSFSTIVQVANGAATGTLMMTLARGLWRIWVTGDYSSNYDGGVAITGDIRLVEPVTGAVNQIMCFNAAAAAFQHDHHDMEFDILLGIDGWLLNANLAANGVGQNHRLATSVFCSKLI